MVLAVPSHQGMMALCAPLAVVAIGLALGSLLSRALDVVLEPGDPRRFAIADAIAYGGTFLALAASLWIQ
jgi:hypothetical protein